MKKLQQLIKNESNRREAQARNTGVFDMHQPSHKGGHGKTMDELLPEDMTLDSQLERLGVQVVSGHRRLLAHLNADGFAPVQCDGKQMTLRVSHVGVITIDDGVSVGGMRNLQSANLRKI